MPSLFTVETARGQNTRLRDLALRTATDQRDTWARQQRIAAREAASWQDLMDRWEDEYQSARTETERNAVDQIYSARVYAEAR